MKQRSLFGLLLLVLMASFLMVGCGNSSEPEVDKNVPMGGANDPFKPTSVSAAGGGSGGNAPSSGGLGTPSAQ